MQYLLPLLLVVLVIQTSVAPPVQINNDNKTDDSEEMANIMEYHRYLKEVIQTLETDPDFRDKLQKADEVDIRSGKIANELEFVNHKVRTKLDELKREELERLRHLATKQYNLMNDLDLDHLKIAEHLDHSNKHTFEIDDLKKLIAKTKKDLEKNDEQRHEEFKQYEMQKKFDEEQKIKAMNEEDRNKYVEELETMKKRHKDHKPLHHPVSKPQLEEVWEKQDHMEIEDFNLKTFFHLHDLDGNGFWDQNEVKALFLKELDKLYSDGAPEDDIMERREEMERMREHVFNEADLNHDGLISFQEFLEQSKKPNFEQDEGWRGLDEQQVYTEQEYQIYEKQRQEELQKMIAKGMLPPPPNTANLPVQHEQFSPQYHQQPQYPGHIPSQQYPPQMPPQQQQYQQQQEQPVPLPQFYQGRIPQQQYQVPVPQSQEPYQGQPPQLQNQPSPQLVQQQLQGQSQQNQHVQSEQIQQREQPETQNQIPQHIQNDVSNIQETAQSSHNLPQQHDPKSALSQNSIGNAKKS